MITSSHKRFGDFGGCYLPELLMPAIDEVARHFAKVKLDPQFLSTLKNIQLNYMHRPTPLTEVNNFRQACKGPRLLLKREDLLHTGAHKINNAIGQCLLAKSMGKIRIIAETGAGQHGVATATACALLGLDCSIFMGEIDILRQQPNVDKIKLLGAQVVAVDTGSKTLKDAVNAALRDYAHSFDHSYYCLGSALGPYPYPDMVAFFQAVIGDEARQQCVEQINRLPNEIIACVGGGSNAIGIFQAFIEDPVVRLTGVEAGGIGNAPGQHAARCLEKKKGVLHGCYSYLLQNKYGQVNPTQSISAGLDYPMIGPQHAYLEDSGRAKYDAVGDDQALDACCLLAKTEGIIPALESAHALAYYQQQATHYDPDDVILLCLSGRGDKDLAQIQTYLNNNRSTS